MGDEEKDVDLEYVARAKDLVREHVEARYRLKGIVGWTKFDVFVIWCSWSETKWTVGLKTSKLDHMYYEVSYDKEFDQTAILFYQQYNKITIVN